MTNKQRQVGVVLIATLFTALLMAVFIIGFIGVTTVDLSVSTNHAETLQAYYIAEAGVADAIAQMRESGTVTNPGSQTFPSGSSDQYSISYDSDTKVITSMGTSQPLGFTRALEVSVLVSGSSAPYTVYIQEWKEVGP